MSLFAQSIKSSQLSIYPSGSFTESSLVVSIVSGCSFNESFLVASIVSGCFNRFCLCQFLWLFQLSLVVSIVSIVVSVVSGCFIVKERNFR